MQQLQQQTQTYTGNYQVLILKKKYRTMRKKIVQTVK